MAWIVHALQPSLFLISLIYIFVVAGYWIGISPAAPTVKNFSWVVIFGFVASSCNFINYLWFPLAKKWLDWIFGIFLFISALAYLLYVVKILVPAVRGCRSHTEPEFSPNNQILISDYFDTIETNNSRKFLEVQHHEMLQYHPDHMNNYIRERRSVSRPDPRIIEPGIYDCTDKGELLIEPIHFALQAMYFVITLLSLVFLIYFEIYDVSDATWCLGFGPSGILAPSNQPPDGTTSVSPGTVATFVPREV